jgi:aryl-alcohol dehydrogenase-like predicted oxidoreductase
MLARSIEADVLPVCQRYRMGVLVWSPLAFGFLSGKYRKDQPVDLTSGRAALRPSRFDPADPANAAQYEAVEKFAGIADDIGCSLPELAVAFTVSHPGVTSAIIGPRTMRQFEDAAKAAALVLDDETLDRIDQIVPPGTNLYEPTGAFPPPVLTDPARRRRPVTDRAAGE